MLKTGDSFERYLIEAAIGQGGMGAVYRAFDERLGRRVALKLIADRGAGAEGSARLVREARAAAALDHPNAVSIFDVGQADGVPYIVMELVSGSTLRGAGERSDVPLATRLDWLAAVARALAAAHRRGLVHRDIKPENVMVRDDGVVKVLDFGIARRAGGVIDPHGGTQSPAIATLTQEGVRLGTPVYMAPEQIRGHELDGRADQFAWGVLAFELLAGRPPWRGSNDAFAVVASILTDEPDAAALELASVPHGVRDVILKALSKRPEDRFATMNDLLQALAAGTQGGEAPSDALPPERASPPRTVTEAQRYSTQEVRDVLAKAVEEQGAKARDQRLGFADLLAIAREVGVDEETLRAVSRALRARDEPAKEPPKAATGESDESAAWLRRRRVAFHRHFGVWVIVNAAIVAVGLLVGMASTLVPLWPFFLPAVLWGIGLSIHGLIALTSTKDDWEEHKTGMDWWHEHTRRAHEVEMARATGKPRRAGERGAEPRVRVDAPASSARQGKVRIAIEESGSYAAAAAEEEAVEEDVEEDAEEDAEPRKKRRKGR